MNRSMIAQCGLALAILGMTLGGCSGHKPATSPAVSRPAIAPPPALPWTQAPLTPGDWRYDRGSGRTAALFAAGSAQPLVAIQCEAATRQIRLLVRSAKPGPVTLSATSGSQTYTGRAIDGASASVAVILQPQDRQLDALAFTRGRFRIAATGRSELVLPVRAEMARVVEDCRR